MYTKTIDMTEKITKRKLFGEVVGGLSVLFLSKNKVGAQETQDLKGTKENKKYELPVPGFWYNLENANFSFFPEKLNFNPEKKILLVNRKWQTASLYNADGTQYLLDGKSYRFLCGTGKLTTPTKLALYETQTKRNGNYRSGKYFVDDRESLGAPMPWTQHLGEISLDKNGNLKSNPSDGTAIHGRKTVGLTRLLPFKSHGCLGVQIEYAENLQKIMNIGDYVLVFEDESLLRLNEIKQMIKSNN